MADANQAALLDARRRAGSSSQMLDSIIQGSNCEIRHIRLIILGMKGADSVAIVDRDEVDRLRKRFMKLDKVGASPYYLVSAPHAQFPCRIIRER